MNPAGPTGYGSPTGTYQTFPPGQFDDAAFGPDPAAAFGPGPADEKPAGGRAALGARARRTLLRRRRRSLAMLGGAAVAIVVVLSVVLLNRGGGQTANISGDFITSFQPGELQKVPNACDVLPGGTIQQYLPGQVKQAAPQPIDGNLGSSCNWTVDHQPVYRLLQVSMVASKPSLLESGNGSATSAAIDTYNQSYQDLKDPPKGTVAGQTSVTPLSGIGNAAYSAMQVFRVGGAVSDMATVVIRFHNVIVTVELSGLQHSNKGHYGPVSQSQLSAGAQAFAQAAYAALH